MFQLGDVLVRLAPKSSQEFEVRCTPRTSRGIAGRLVFTSRKEAGAQAATLVFGLVCHTQSLSPIRSFNIESRLYEMNQLVRATGSCFQRRGKPYPSKTLQICQ